MLHVGILQFTLDVRWAQSLKDKRSVVQSIKDRSRKRFNLSIAEIDDLESPTTATMGAVMAGNDTKYILGALEKFLTTIRGFRDADLVDSRIEIL
ncbi:MAG: DUF503 domain-containing protein [Planctomycetota bacterium]